MYESFWPEKVDHGVFVAPLCYFSLLLVVSAEQCSPTYRLPLKEKQRGKHFQWPLVAFKKVKWRTTMTWIAHGWTPLHFVPALGLFSRAVRSWQGGLLQVFPRFQSVIFFCAWHRMAYCNFSRSFNQLLFFRLGTMPYLRTKKSTNQYQISQMFSKWPKTVYRSFLNVSAKH